jgi:hypothetical protein
MEDEADLKVIRKRGNEKPNPWSEAKKRLGLP